MNRYQNQNYYIPQSTNNKDKQNMPDNIKYFEEPQPKVHEDDQNFDYRPDGFLTEQTPKESQGQLDSPKYFKNPSTVREHNFDTAQLG